MATISVDIFLESDAGTRLSGEVVYQYVGEHEQTVRVTNGYAAVDLHEHREVVLTWPATATDANGDDYDFNGPTPKFQFNTGKHGGSLPPARSNSYARRVPAPGASPLLPSAAVATATAIPLSGATPPSLTSPPSAATTGTVVGSPKAVATPPSTTVALGFQDKGGNPRELEKLPVEFYDPCDGKLLDTVPADANANATFKNAPSGLKPGHLLLVKVPQTITLGTRQLRVVGANATQVAWGDPLQKPQFVYAADGPARGKPIQVRVSREADGGNVAADGVRVRLSWTEAGQRKSVSGTTSTTGVCALTLPNAYDPGSLSVDIDETTTIAGTPYQADVAEVRVPDGGDRAHLRYHRRNAVVVGSVVTATGEGIPDVKVRLAHAGAEGVGCEPLTATTCGTGCYIFPNVPPGRFELLFPGKVPYLGHSLETPAASTPGYARAGHTTTIPPLEYAAAKHRILWKVTAGGQPVGGVLVVAQSKATGQEFTAFTANDTGVAVIDTGSDGDFLVTVQPDWTKHTYRETVPVNSTYQGVSEIAPAAAGQAGAFLPPPGPRPPSGGDFAGDIQAYPILTSDAFVRGGGSPSGGGAAGVAGYTAVVQNTLREVLGWRPKAGDSKAFTAALAKSFSPYDSNGNTLYKWTPRTYLADVNADLGALTGAQASLYQRAKVALDQSLPLLEGLYPLLPDYDPQDVEASRALVRSDLSELVGELGVIGGPRPQRVDRYFSQLLGPNGPANLRTTTTQLPPGCTLRRMEDRFGLTQAQVNTVEEEENLTNFLILVDYVRSLRATWDANRPYFDRGASSESVPPFLGTQVILLSRALGVVAESVREVEAAMDSVFLGPEQRTTVRLDMGADEPDLFASELLDWASDVATEEGPRLLQDAGRDGVVSVGGTLLELAGHVESALLAQYDAGGKPVGPGLQPRTAVPPAYATPRVQRALQELATQLRIAHDLTASFTAKA